MAPAHKRQRLSPTDDQSIENELAATPVNESEEDIFMDGDGEMESGAEPDSEMDEDDEIEGMKPQKSRQTTKRKLRATTTSKFGATLEFLLNTEAPSALPLSLKPSIARKRNDEKLELRAKKVLQVEKKEKEDKGRIKDVIGGWGGESERALRKVAQRGVVRLFNVIQQSQSSTAAAVEETKANRGTGKPTLPAPALENKSKAKGKKKDNIIGRGKEATVDKDDFFKMIKSGGVVSKA
ncbi:Rrp15p-domain-containing protein [Crepidotus variabilis]|uniref:Rrp15p-domain-containing protein n=1 Tax=Crepidotus variabilis TaxID=179855 RepID=A0A9P6EUB0_9AGAR|nr:Rrp15p-domain-containing protein [Crepidotus variabilis]